MRPLYYILKDKIPVPVSNMEETLEMWKTGEARRVKSDVIYGIHISTVFLSIDHNFYDKGLPILFETMIFGGKYNDYQERYETWDQALVGHEIAVQMVKNTPQFQNILYFLKSKIQTIIYRPKDLKNVQETPSPKK